MSGNNIIHLNLDNSNVTSSTKNVAFNIVNTKNFIDNAFDYEVYIEKSEIPFPKDLPYVVSNNPVSIVLEATDKNDKDPIFGNELFKTFQLPREYHDLPSIIEAINSVIYDKLTEAYRWARLSTEDNRIMSLSVMNAASAPKTKIWIDGMFTSLFEEIPRDNIDTYIQGHQYFELVSYKDINHVYTQSRSYMAEIVNLKTFRLYSTLPTESYWLYNQNTGDMVPSNLFGEVIYNSKEMYGNTNLLYIPYIFKPNSMTDAGAISKFEVWCTAYYFNGREIPLTMTRNTYFSITFTFERKVKI